MKYLIGTKKAMTQLFAEDGRVIPVTAVKVEHNVVTQIKTVDRDGYLAVQVGYGQRRKSMAKAQRGHVGGLGNFKDFREFRLASDPVVKVGDQLIANVFSAGDDIKVVGWSKGRGFTGVVKRYGFHGQDKTHGHKDQERKSGSIGAGGVQEVHKGTRMAGRSGNERVTQLGLSIAKVDADQSVIYIAGSIPGAFNSMVCITAEGEIPAEAITTVVAAAPVTETPVTTIPETETTAPVVEAAAEPAPEVAAETGAEAQTTSS